ncbi:MAG: hypothetical protein KatS3mg077_0816 [Candidatus Binatia bacterium]|nr:MAG: hypothetical protein KatS3mg077_0816 [Candidatus Binatia bacterium]
MLRRGLLALPPGLWSQGWIGLVVWQRSTREAEVRNNDVGLRAEVRPRGERARGGGGPAGGGRRRCR